MNISQILQEVEKNRASLTKALLYFAQTDTILFAFNAECQQKFSSLVTQVNTILNSSFSTTLDIIPPKINQQQTTNLLSYLEQLSLNKFTILYLIATEIRSVLLAILFIEKNIDTNALIQSAYFEEIYQQNLWGKNSEAETKYNLIKNKISELEQFEYA